MGCRQSSEGAFRGRGSYGGAGVVEKYREDNPQSEQADEAK